MKPRLILSREFVQVLIERGLVPSNTRRVIIDAEVEQPVHVYYEVLGDARLLDVVQDPRVRIEERQSEPAS